ncbi:hypothetical protein [Bizionia paragorgiae]|uniref:Uncharacterized protein n=1 Tax=Bizionia paragorgiae TaxID=283786 RepID=A0A1H4CK94_BIZPA|nr:hypothetical protein [Bizionia paragorgiae]SEA60866.1 hypothetical protein SAMN04487990_12038 [Bizionia paragorgiae]
MKKKLTLIILLFYIVSCKTSKEPVKIKFTNSTQEVILFYSKKMNTVSVISLPFDIEIINSYSEEKAFRNYTYNYGNQLKGNPIQFYLVDNKELIKQSFSEEKYIDSKKTNKYLIKSKHFVDTTKFNRHFFKPYIEKMQSLKQDTLNIGTISQLKAKHKDLLDQLIKNDSVSFLFYDKKTKSGFKKETLAVEY